jgi:hypothetical protein
MLISAFNAYQWDDMPAFKLISVWKKIEIDYLETTTFSATVCPTQVFCSRQIK